MVEGFHLPIKTTVITLAYSELDKKIEVSEVLRKKRQVLNSISGLQELRFPTCCEVGRLKEDVLYGISIEKLPCNRKHQRIQHWL